MGAYLGKPANLSWNDFVCKGSGKSANGAKCGACSISSTARKGVHLILRGLCSDTALDNVYSISNDEDGYVMYHGHRGTVIKVGFLH